MLYSTVHVVRVCTIQSVSKMLTVNTVNSLLNVKVVVSVLLLLSENGFLCGSVVKLVM